jgi:hypothetical protein
VSRIVKSAGRTQMWGSQARGTSRCRLQDNISSELVEPSCEACGLSSVGSSGSTIFSEKDGDTEESWEFLER